MTVTAVNDEPSLTATAANPTFTENGPAVALYSGTVINVVEAAGQGQDADVDGVGAAKRGREILVVDGTNVALTGDQRDDDGNGIGYSVAVTGGTATVTLSKTGGMAVAEAQTLVDGLKYRNTSEDPLGSAGR